MHYTTTPLPAPTRGQPHDCAAANPTPTPNTGPATLQSAMFSKRSLAINAPSSSPCHHHPRRAVMYVPGSDERKVAKATGLSVDCLVYDIEDGVAVSQKDKARHSIPGAIAKCRLQNPKAEKVVRVNAVDSGMIQADLAAIFGKSHDQASESCDRSKPDALMLPKVDSEEHLAELDMLLAFHAPSPPSHPHHPPLPLLIITETPRGLLRLREILQFGTERCTNFQLSGVVFGSDDFLARLGGTRTKAASELTYARQTVVSTSRAFDLAAIDLVDIDYRDLDGLRTQAEEGARLGFSGKQVIHPSQVPVVQRAFSPSPGHVTWAAGLIAAFRTHQESGKGAFVYEGHMIDRPLLLQAENVMRLHETYSS